MSPHLPACPCLDCIVETLLREPPETLPPLPEDQPTLRELPDAEDPE